MKNDFEILGYYVSSDPDVMDFDYKLPTELRKDIDELYDIAMKGKISGVKKLHRYINKYPDCAQLKNYLSVLYRNMDKLDKAVEVNKWLVAEHPLYLYGLSNLAFTHYFNGQHEEMPKLLGEGFQLKTLYPNRDTFHVNEVTTMGKVAVHYYCAIGDLEQAKIRLKIIEKVDPFCEDYFQSLKEIEYRELALGLDDFEDLEDGFFDAITPEINDIEYNNLSPKMPEFGIKKISELYEHGLRIDPNIIVQLLDKDRDDLIYDLETVLNDSIDRFAYFYSQEKKGK